jgi:hypothetical protein
MVENNDIYAKVVRTNKNLTDLINTNLSTLTISISALASSASLLGIDIGLIDDKIGEDTDVYTDETIFGQLDKENINNYTSSFIYPTGTTGTTLATGSYVEVIPANTITNPFSIVGLIAGDMLTPGGWRSLEIAKGGAGAEVNIATTATYITTYSFSVGTSISGNPVSGYTLNMSTVSLYFNKAGYLPVTTPILPANTRVSARLTGSATATIKLVYQEYI